jgi:hypothetical protein
MQCTAVDNFITQRTLLTYIWPFKRVQPCLTKFLITLWYLICVPVIHTNKNNTSQQAHVRSINHDTQLPQKPLSVPPNITNNTTIRLTLKFTDNIWDTGEEKYIRNSLVYESLPLPADLLNNAMEIVFFSLLPHSCSLFTYIWLFWEQYHPYCLFSCVRPLYISSPRATNVTEHYQTCHFIFNKLCDLNLVS